VDYLARLRMGALSDAVLGYFDWQQKDYKRIPIDEQVEVLNLTGNIALADGEPKLHPHIVLGKADGTACGGHLLEAHVRPTLEVIITESPAHLQRRSDPETGLALIRL
jgi:predicted DNA-binding protein with PD1-like motif